MELVAIAFFCGERGFYSKPSKRFLQEGIDRFKESLSVAKRKDFEDILANVVIQFGEGKFGPTHNYGPVIESELDEN
jgi:hypothetical protein